MKAVVLEKKRQVHITDFPEPPLNDDSVKIEVSYCGICGTDIHKFEGLGGSRPMVLPVPLGHEASGVVVELGKNVDSFKIGDRVTIDPNWYCKHCYYCNNGLTHLCENSKGVVKGMAQYICPPFENVYKIPDSLGLLEAALVEPLSCCIHGIDLANIVANDTVVLFGFGSIGMLMLELLNTYSINTIVVDIDESKRNKALEMGAMTFINSQTESIGDNINTHIHAVIECVGIKQTIESSIDIAQRGTTVVIFGVSSPDTQVSFNPYKAFQNEITIKTSYINPHTTQRAIDLLDKDLINTSKIISKVIEMEEVPNELVNKENINKGKVIVKINT